MNPRIPEIVKILANLVQELDNAQENRESLEVLGRIKLYSAQLYLETDMEIIALNRDDLDEEMEFEDDEFSTTEITSPEIEKNTSEIHRLIETIEFNTPEEEEIEVEFYPLEEPETEEFEIEFMEDIEGTTIQEEVKNVEFPINSEGKNDDQLVVHNDLEYEDLDQIGEDNDDDDEDDIEEDEDYDDDEDEENDDEDNDSNEFGDDDDDKKDINDEFIIPTSNNSENENLVTNDLQNSQEEKPRQPELFHQAGDLEAHKTKAQEILGMFSLSRRFEFANLLFAGDMQQFILFLCEVLAAPNNDAREDVIDEWYEKNQWRRKDETASDLKRNLRKML